MNRTSWAVVVLAAAGLTVILWFLTYLVPVELRQHNVPPAKVFFWVALILLVSLAYARRGNSRLRERVRALEAEQKSAEQVAAGEDAPKSE